ncbi:MAG: hydrolase [Candidatus Altiarchaeota archaeon]|nr:hydrolase [Candidatus Altiarchaeota archaeon]
MISRDESVLVVVDIQEKFRPHIHEWDVMLGNSIKLIKGLKILDVPVVVTEQYPKGLGETVAEIKEVLEFKPVEKTCFSCMGEEGFRKNISGKKQVILCGIEAHVCIMQTTLQLLDEGYEVYLVVDAMSSRKKSDKRIALRRATQKGAIPVSTEMVLFELLKDAKNLGFKEIQAIVK